jgi:hypothetical protein
VKLTSFFRIQGRVRETMENCQPRCIVTREINKLDGALISCNHDLIDKIDSKYAHLGKFNLKTRFTIKYYHPLKKLLFSLQKITTINPEIMIITKDNFGKNNVAEISPKVFPKPYIGQGIKGWPFNPAILHFCYLWEASNRQQRKQRSLIGEKRKLLLELMTRVYFNNFPETV